MREKNTNNHQLPSQGNSTHSCWRIRWGQGHSRARGCNHRWVFQGQVALRRRRSAPRRRCFTTEMMRPSLGATAVWPKTVGTKQEGGEGGGYYPGLGGRGWTGASPCCCWRGGQQQRTRKVLARCHVFEIIFQLLTQLKQHMSTPQPDKYYQACKMLGLVYSSFASPLALCARPCPDSPILFIVRCWCLDKDA